VPASDRRLGAQRALWHTGGVQSDCVFPSTRQLASGTKRGADPGKGLGLSSLDPCPPSQGTAVIA
jgi:hypothetical protein